MESDVKSKGLSRFNLFLGCAFFLLSLNNVFSDGVIGIIGGGGGGGTAPPSVVVTSPANGTVVTNPVVTVMGTATGFTNLQGWVENDSLGQNFEGLFIFDSWGAPSAWSFEAGLVGGYNTVGARAYLGNGLNLDGYSRIYYKQLTPLTVAVNGPGKVTPNLNGRILETSKVYQMLVKPKAGYAFAGWTGDLTTNASTLNFTMASNLLLQANFVRTPFTSAAGAYQGQITPANATQDSVVFKAKVSRDGTFTAKIQLRNASYGNVVNGNYALSGAFSADGSYSGSFYLKRGKWLVNLQLYLDANGRTITGTITDTYAVWTGELAASSLKR